MGILQKRLKIKLYKPNETKNQTTHKQRHTRAIYITLCICRPENAYVGKGQRFVFLYAQIWYTCITVCLLESNINSSSSHSVSPSCKLTGVIQISNLYWETPGITLKKVTYCISQRQQNLWIGCQFLGALPLYTTNIKHADLISVIGDLPTLLSH